MPLLPNLDCGFDIDFEKKGKISREKSGVSVRNARRDIYSGRIGRGICLLTFV